MHLAGCAYGHTEVVIRDYRYDVPLATYPVTIHEPPPAESFDIDLVFIDPAFTERQKTLIRQAADRWELVITEGLDDVSTVDDLRIRVGRLSEDDWAGGRAAPSAVRPNGKPFAAWMKFNRSMLAQAEDSYQWRLRHPDWIILTETAEDALENLALHEIGHCLGIAGTTSTYATSWGALVSHDGSPHFAGPLAIEAFNVAGGGSYVGEKVPLEPNANHWREAVFTNNWIMWDPAGWRWEDLIRELMSVGGGGALSAITISALADMGYRVDLAQADPYQLPPAVTTKPVAVKPVARPPTRLPWLCGGR